MFSARWFGGQSSKPQIPSSKEVPNPKVQTVRRFFFWFLKFGVSLGFGTWNLELSLRQVVRRLSYGELVCSEAARCNHRRRVWRTRGRQEALLRSGPRHGGRPNELPFISTTALSSRDRGAFAGRHRRSGAGDLEQMQKHGG